jgi:hypothetical protein
MLAPSWPSVSISFVACAASISLATIPTGSFIALLISLGRSSPMR